MCSFEDDECDLANTSYDFIDLCVTAPSVFSILSWRAVKLLGLPLVGSPFMLPVASFALPCYVGITLLICLHLSGDTVWIQPTKLTLCLHRPKKFHSNFCITRIFTVWGKHQLINQNIFKVVGQNNVCFNFDKSLFSSSL